MGGFVRPSSPFPLCRHSGVKPGFGRVRARASWGSLAKRVAGGWSNRRSREGGFDASSKLRIDPFRADRSTRPLRGSSLFPAYAVLMTCVRSLLSCIAFCSNASRLHCHGDEVSQQFRGEHPRQADEPPLGLLVVAVVTGTYVFEVLALVVL